MLQEEMLKLYQDWKFKCSAYQMALNIITIDKQTVAPPDGAAYRDERTAFLGGELFSLETDPQMVEILAALKDSPEVDAVTRREAYLYWDNAVKTLVIPKEEYVAFQQLASTSYDAWYKAKQASDYRIFAPYLKQLITEKKKMYGYRNRREPLYDQMLDDFEPGMNMAKYDAFFTKLKARLVPLIQKVVVAGPIDESFLKLDYPADEQKKYTETVLLPYLGFTKNWGYQNETEHPFTDWTCENDCRTTTKYITNNIASGIFSTIHETGHAWYMHDVDPAYDGSILSFGISSGMHESQSRFCENYLGRRSSFWEYHFPRLQEMFPKQLGEVSPEAFVRGINASKPSPVRTEADELTYPLHIVIRYEIEKGICDGSVDIDRLDETWNAMYRQYLGLDIANDREGILQDVHWSSGDFGYFPTYALGSAFAAQFFAAMQKDVDVDAALRQGQYMRCMDWLKKHIHTYGCRYNAEEIMTMATGEPFSPAYYLDYLEEKYSRLYAL